MAEIQWEVVYETNGMLLAEILRGLLEAQEIRVVLSQEGVGRVYGLTVGTLGRVQVLVPASELERAQQILQEYETNSIADIEASDTDMTDQENLDDSGEPDENETA